MKPDDPLAAKIVDENGDSYLSFGSVEAVKLAAGAVSTMVSVSSKMPAAKVVAVCTDHLVQCMFQAVLVSGEVRNGICLVRPPGHHFGKCGKVGTSYGCCFTNLAAVAIQTALEDNKDNRILLLDVDGHHCEGNPEEAAAACL